MQSPDGLAPYSEALDRIDTPVRRALDVGTGNGRGASEIKSRHPEAEVVGLDVSPAMLQEARHLLPDVEFVEGDASRLPFVAGEFDLVAHANMIPFIDEVARVLRPGGWTIFAFSGGDETPIYVAPARLKRELRRRGFTDFAEIAAGRGTAMLARRGNPH
jgi:ubiquinone/menaquinone biosynthesis C-methylase UbiE